jgi:hypothetical protein
MSILKSFICAVLFLAHATSGRPELFVNCMAAPDSIPEDENGCDNVNRDVLQMLEHCSAPTGGVVGYREMKFVGRLHGYTPPTRRLLRSGEQRQIPREQSERRLSVCQSTELSAGERMACCMYSGDIYSYCGSPTGNRRVLADTKKKIAEEIGTSKTPSDDVIRSLQDEADMLHITQECTTAFRGLAVEYALQNLTHCLGSSADVFCESIQVSVGLA